MQLNAKLRTKSLICFSGISYFLSMLKKANTKMLAPVKLVRKETIVNHLI